jgi:two-component system response regulator GlrR
MNMHHRVLLVDDDPDLLQLLSIRLQRAEFAVNIADSAESALALMPTFRPHVLVTDLRMTGMDGMALFAAVQQHQPLLPVIVLTAHGTIPEAVDATRRGVFAYLTKPYDGDDLVRQIRKAVDVVNPSPDAPSASVDGDWRREILSRSSVMEECLAQARMVAASEVSVVILGESGTGKELLARALHRASPRCDGPFVAIDCTAIPEPLLESELFGHRKGAFTGATENREGLLRAANGGTLFLDEVGDMPIALQARLLRTLQEKEVRPVGDTRGYPTDVRVLAATHRNLDEQVESGAFREDLYYRLNVMTLEIPPLAARREDIPLLAAHFLEEARTSSPRETSATGFAADAMEALLAARWPGNVRHLRNVVNQCAVLATTPLVSLALVQKALRLKPPDLLSLADARNQFDREYLIKLLQITEGNVTQAARLADRNRSDLYKLLRRHKLDPEVFRDEVE